MKTIPSPEILESSPENMLKNGILEIPPNANSIIVFVHGPGRRCLSPRNRLVARCLVHRGFAVALPDLADQDADHFDSVSPDDSQYLDRIATRLTAVIDWLAKNPRTRGMHIGLFGARTGAAAAMIAAARRPKLVRAVISRGGRPDLAQDQLKHVHAPTLMIVGAKDPVHITHNRHAGGAMHKKPMIEVVQGANHLFSEPGMIDKVASMACLWFQRNLALRV